MTPQEFARRIGVPEDDWLEMLATVEVLIMADTMKEMGALTSVSPEDDDFAEVVAAWKNERFGGIE